MVEIDSIIENARREGIPLSQIALFYRDLTPDEAKLLDEANLITHVSEDGMVIAKFPPDGDPLVPSKISAAHLLGAY